MVGVALGADKHQHLLHVAVFDQVGEQGTLLVGIHLVHAVGDEIGRCIAARDFDRDRRAQHLFCKAFDFDREGRGKQQALALRRQQREDALEIRHEAHVEHAIGFVEHQYFNAAKIDRLLLHVIKQASRCCNHDFGAGAQGFYLRIDIDAAEHHGRAQVQVFCVVADVVLDLSGEFTRRCQYQSTDGVAGRGGAGTLLRRQQLQNRQCEAGGLAGAGLGATHHVMAREYRWNGLQLDGSRLGVTLVGDCVQQLGHQPERLKRH